MSRSTARGKAKKALSRREFSFCIVKAFLLMFLHEHPFLKLFTREQALSLQETGKVKIFRKGETLFREKDPSDFVVLLLDGTIELLKQGKGEDKMVLAQMKEGALFGELGVLDGSPRSATAQAVDTVSAVLLPAQEFLDILRAAPLEVFQSLFRQTSDNLRRTNNDLMTAVLNKEKMTLIGEMASSIIHDFRNPFAHIRLIGDIIAQRKNDEELTRLGGSLMRQIDRMENMVTDLLEFSRGQPKLELEIISLRQLFAQLLADNESILKKKGVHLEGRVEGHKIKGDIAKLTRVLQNLISNAAQAMEKQQGEKRIIVSSRKHFDEIELLVQDNGPGIPEAIRENLFEPFVTHGKAEGTGIGLSIVRSIIEAHGGTIRCETKSGEGTTFIMQFPVPEED